MPELVKTKIDIYTMKMQLYPSRKQAAEIDDMIYGVQFAYNKTFYEIFQKNPEVCTEPDKNGSIWPDWQGKICKGWLNTLRKMNPCVDKVPAPALSTNVGVFKADAKKAWEKGMCNLPVDKAPKDKFRYYSKKDPRRSFTHQMYTSQLETSETNCKVAWIKIGYSFEGHNKEIKIKARGFNNKIWFSKKGESTYLTFKEAREAGILPEKLTVKVCKDKCGDYFALITFNAQSVNNKPKKFDLYRELPPQKETSEIGIDVGIKDIAVLSTGEKYKNLNNIESQHNKYKDYKKRLQLLNRQMSRRFGPANMEFREYQKLKNKIYRAEHPDDTKRINVIPSKGYAEKKLEYAKLERKITRKREAYYHKITLEIVRKASYLAVETLRLDNMRRNHKLAGALAGASISTFNRMLVYKAGWYGIDIGYIGMFEPTSQRCSDCGNTNEAVKNLSVREWTCPNCGHFHDRDINAAKNIIQKALENRNGNEIKADEAVKEGDEGKSEKEQNEQKKQKEQNNKKKVNPKCVYEDNPDIIVRISEELTKPRDPRYVVEDKKNKVILDDAQGYGYRSIAKAKNGYKKKSERKRAERCYS